MEQLRTEKNRTAQFQDEMESHKDRLAKELARGAKALDKAEEAFRVE